MSCRQHERNRSCKNKTHSKLVLEKHTHYDDDNDDRKQENDDKMIAIASNPSLDEDELLPMPL